jgi:tRNA 2-thiouridine synthesizing protein E
MLSQMQETLISAPPIPADPDFPNAPIGWSRSDAEHLARQEGMELTVEHWEAIHGLQEYFARHEGMPTVNLHELHDALDEHFHSRGGMKMLYLLFPGGPVAQGCRLAGLKAPEIAADVHYGSVA